MSDNITKRVGLGTAYGFAKAGGYEGTVEEFTELLGNIAIDLARIENLSVTVTTLPAGSQATASLNGSVLSLGIPKGDKGDKGNTGDTGSPAGFGTVSATVDANIGTPSVEVTASGADTAKNFAFAFHNLKGQKGDKGDTGEVSEAELAEAIADFSENGTVANAEQLTTKIRANDQTPYLFRTSGGSVDIGDREYINGIVGGTVAFNQLGKEFAANNWQAESGVTVSFDNGVAEFTSTAINNGIKTGGLGVRIIDGHKYLALVSVKSSSSASGQKLRIIASGQATPVFDIADITTSFSTVGRVASAGSDQTLSVYIYPTSSSALNVTISLKDFLLIDLTQMFGSTIADYIYSLEQATAGAGVAFFKSLFPKPYYAYNSGELKSVSGLVSHDMVGFNAFDLTSGKAKVVGGHQYEIVGTYTSLSLDGETITPSSGKFTPSKDGELTVVGGNSTTCVHLVWDGSEDGNYEPYQKWSYPLDTDLELRGIPKLDANNSLYYDGDVYEPDGTVTRKYGIVDLGTLTWNRDTTTRPFDSATIHAFYAGVADMKKYRYSVNPNLLVVGYEVAAPSDVDYGGRDSVKDRLVGGADANGRFWLYDSRYNEFSTSQFTEAVSGLYAVYELATPTTETADPYQATQIVNDFGTEEFVISNTIDVPIPVGHNTDYPVDLKAKVEMAPNSPDGDGDYIVRQTNGTNEYVSIANNATIQNILARLEALEG